MNQDFCSRPDAGLETGKVTHAVVHACGIATGYAQAGRGSPVVLLAISEDRDDAFLDLIAELARTHRVVVPDAEALLRLLPPMLEPAATKPGSDPACRWLGHFLDGLGIDRAAFIALRRCIPLARCFAHHEPERVLELILHDD